MSRNIDFLLDEDGDLPINGVLVEGDLVTLQRISRRLNLFRGEWIIDGSKGLPFLAWLAQKPPNVDSIGAEILNEILTTPCVATVISFASTFDFENQRVLISGTVILDSRAAAEFEFAPKLGANSLPYVAILFASQQVIP